LPRNYDQIELSFSWNGDYELGPDGDLFDTRDDQIEALRQMVVSIVRSEFRDWEFFPYFGADIESFIGEPNTRDTAQAIHKRLFESIVANAKVQPSDLAIKVTPVNHESVLVLIAVQAMPTTRNSLEEGFLRLQFLFMFGGKGIVI